MKNAHVGTSRHSMSQYMSHEKRIHTSPDYFNEALRILDNDITLMPQREHLAALWGLVIGLSHRLTQASAATRKTITDERRKKNREKHTDGKTISTASLDADGPGGAV